MFDKKEREEKNACLFSLSCRRFLLLSIGSPLPKGGGCLKETVEKKGRHYFSRRRDGGLKRGGAEWVLVLLVVLKVANCILAKFKDEEVYNVCSVKKYFF